MFRKAVKNKFGAVKRKADGYTFDSIAEYKRYIYLRARMDAGEIDSLDIHPIFVITINNRKIGKAIMDFLYYDNSLGHIVVEDVKGVDTSLSRWKRKCVEAQYNLKVEVIKQNNNEKFQG